MKIKTFNDGMSLRSNEIRVSYPHLFTPETTGLYPSGKYILTAEADEELVKACKEIVNTRFAWAIENYGDWKGRKPKDFTITKIKEKENEAGVSLITLKTGWKPQVIDRMKHPITDPVEVYGGMYAIITIDTFAWGNTAKGGVSLSLGGVIQKTRDGKRYGGSSGDVDLFDVINDDDVATAVLSEAEAGGGIATPSSDMAGGSDYPDLPF